MAASCGTWHRGELRFLRPPCSALTTNILSVQSPTTATCPHAPQKRSVQRSKRPKTAPHASVGCGVTCPTGVDVRQRSRAGRRARHVPSLPQRTDVHREPAIYSASSGVANCVVSGIPSDSRSTARGYGVWAGRWRPQNRSLPAFAFLQPRWRRAACSGVCFVVVSAFTSPRVRGAVVTMAAGSVDVDGWRDRRDRCVAVCWRASGWLGGPVVVTIRWWCSCCVETCGEWGARW